MNRHIKTSGAVLLAGALFAAGGMATATAKSLITGDDIANNTVTAKNLAPNSVGKSELQAGLEGKDGKDGKDGKTAPAPPAPPVSPAPQAPRAPAASRASRAPPVRTARTVRTAANGTNGTNGTNGADWTYSGEYWSIVDRNVTATATPTCAPARSARSPVARSCRPASARSASALGCTTARNASKTAFGNEIDFAGQRAAHAGRLLGLHDRREQRRGVDVPGLGNMPSIQLEIDPNLTAAAFVDVHYSTLIYVPGNTAAGAVDPDRRDRRQAVPTGRSRRCRYGDRLLHLRFTTAPTPQTMAALTDDGSLAQADLRAGHQGQGLRLLRRGRTCCASTATRTTSSRTASSSARSPEADVTTRAPDSRRGPLASHDRARNRASHDRQGRPQQAQISGDQGRPTISDLSRTT